MYLICTPFCSAIRLSFVSNTKKPPRHFGQALPFPILHAADAEPTGIVSSPPQLHCHQPIIPTPAPPKKMQNLQRGFKQ